MADWRASSKLEQTAAPSPPRKLQKQHGEERDKEDEMTDVGAMGSGDRQEDGSPPALTGSRKGGDSSGRAPKSRSGTKGGGKGGAMSTKELTNAVQLLAKASLSSHDTLREIQMHLGFTYIYAQKDHKVMKVNLDEGASYYKLKASVLKQHEKDTPEKRTEELKKLGPASASQFLAVVTKLVEEEPAQNDASSRAHWTALKELQNELEAGGLEQAVRAAGTWQIRKAHGDGRKIFAKPQISPERLTSLVFFLRKAGMKVYENQKPPGDGLHRAVQGILD